MLGKDLADSQGLFLLCQIFLNYRKSKNRPRIKMRGRFLEDKIINSFRDGGEDSNSNVLSECRSSHP